MKIILTGATGFLGLTIVGSKISEIIITLSTKNSNLNVDLSTCIPELPKSDIVIHSAGKAHSIPKTPQSKQEFFAVNVTGTENLLKGLERSNALPDAFVFISTVAVYGKDSGYLIKEDAPLLAKDPYGYSKALAEGIVLKWCQENNVRCAILRLPLIVGTNPPGNLKAMINGLKKGYYFNISGGKAKKSMVLAEDVAKIIPVAAKIGGIYNLTDGHHPSFVELSNIIANLLGKPKPLNIPMWLARLMAKVGDLVGDKAPINSNKLVKIISDLTFDDSKARKLLGWKPNLVLKGFKIK